MGVVLEGENIGGSADFPMRVHSEVYSLLCVEGVLWGVLTDQHSGLRVHTRVYSLFRIEGALWVYSLLWVEGAHQGVLTVPD